MAFPDPRYVASVPLQYYFVDKDTSAPLSNGVVTFYEQENQTVLKSVYQMNDSSPTGFSVLPNPLQLSMVGTFVDDNGNDIVPYFYPFDSAGDEELYFVRVESAGGVEQFTRENWPPDFGETAVEPGSSNSSENFVSNGQFLLHNNNPTSATITTIASDTVTYIAPGGWTFEKEATSTSSDVVSFTRVISASTEPNVDANPRYLFDLLTTGIDTNYARKDLCLTFPDVNKFAGINGTTTSFYTLACQGLAVSGGTAEVDIRVRKFFGTGGSTPTDVSVGTLVISTSQQVYNIVFQFGENAGDNVGPNDDDFVQLCLRFPNASQEIKLTDFVLMQGAQIITAFPQTPNGDFIKNSTVGALPTPNQNGLDNGLPLILNPRGAVYDHSRIGSVISAFYTPNYALNNKFPVLYCDGTAYLTSGISPNGIPYSRLGAMMIANGALPNTPINGTGTNFVTMFAVGGLPTEMNLIINGGTPASAPTVGTTSFTLTGGTNNYTFTVPAIPTASQYFTFQTVESTPRNFFVWYQISGSATPTATGTGIPVVLTGTETAAQVVTKTLTAINAYQFAVPNLIGMFLRGLDMSGAVDPDFASRVISALGLTGAYVGSLEGSQFLSHQHNIILSNSSDEYVIGTGRTPAVLKDGPTPTQAAGGNETRPINIAVYYFIYY